jgi:hypothetical protein
LLNHSGEHGNATPETQGLCKKIETPSAEWMQAARLLPLVALVRAIF